MTTAEGYYALRLCGLPASDPRLARAREMVLARGGVNRARFFTKLWLAVLGRYPWSALPALPPEMILLPARAPMSPYRFASWARGTFVALMVVLTRNPTFPQPVGLDELFLEPPGAGPSPRPKTPGPWTPVLSSSLALARLYNRRPIRPLRRLAEARVARWICERQEADGSWGGIQPPWVYSILALHALGFPLDHPVIARAWPASRGPSRWTSTTASASASRRACRRSGTPRWRRSPWPTRGRRPTTPRWRTRRRGSSRRR